MMHRLAIDPGLHSPGATWAFDTTIIRTGHFRPELSIADGIGARCLDIASQIACATLYPVEVIFEWPQHYDSRQGKTKGNPNNLTPLAGIGMAVCGILRAKNMLIGEPVTPMPAQWIGQLPKQCPCCERTPGKNSCKVCHGSAWKTPRGRMIRNNLTQGELLIVPDQNDVIDSAGIMLWRLGRLRPTIPGLVTG